jgi:branched-chain amino acid transport system substrate-binding protein
MRKIGMIVFLGILGFFSSDLPDALAKGKEVVIGFIGPLTGGAAYLGVDALRGVQIAAEELNAAGGITVASQKYKVRIESYDDEATPAKSIAGLKRLKDLYDIPVVINDISGSAMAIIEINERMGILWMGFAKNPDITKKGNKLVLRCDVPGSRDAELLAEGAIKVLNAKAFTILSDTGDYGRSFRAVFLPDMEKRGAKHLGTEWLDMRKDTDFRVQITKIKALNPDTVAVLAYDEATGQIINQCREMGIMVPLVTSPGFQTKGRKITGAKNIEGCLNVLIPQDFQPVPKSLVNYRTTYQRKFNEQSGAYGENNYEALYMIVRGMEKAGNVNDAYKIKEGMKAAVPIEEEHLTTWLSKWTEGGDAIVWKRVGVYRNGQLVLPNGRPASPQD